jgi:pimeloyl-ACP methyl ester carboxylesterase
MSKSDCFFARLRNGLRLAYAEQGPADGVPIIMLHGLSDSHRSFDLMRPLLPRSWRVIAVTMRGHGLSDKPEADYAMGDFADDVAEFMDVVGIERAVLVDHSMSTAIALQTASHHPERVAGLVLIGAFAHFRDTAAVNELHDAVFDFGENCGGEFALAFQESTLANMIPQRFLDMVVNETLCMPGYAWRGAVQGLIGFEPVDAARRCQAPAAIIWGERDAYCPRADQHDLRAALPSSRLFSLPGVGHAVHWERPAVVASILRAFVAELDSASVAAE